MRPQIIQLVYRYRQMLRHCRMLRRQAAAWVVLGAALLLASWPASSHADNGDITLDAASSEVDYRSNTLLFRDVVITQGNVRVAAQRARATGLDFNDSTWTFSGMVRLLVDGGELRSDEATVVFARNQIVRATIRGKQAEFEQKLRDGGNARGRAGSITYEMTAGTVTLRDDAWLSDNGRSEIRGDPLVYNVREQRVQAGKPTGSSERVRIVIRPRPATETADTVPPKP
ncbi:MAG: lipopolysaccharide transport periplasmic protein LptA [Gammaproteobacteria bacterium]|nr:lipopolysaccharide transport periplasmic protein LptA [Gammaproteobacteria bacterium]MBM4230887.1 lipopolysaccharide transport periplasmic protein LptA [Gammaproteobacteria bacterium]